MYVDKVNTKTTSQTWSAKIGSTTDTTGTVQSLIRRSSPCVAETSELFLCLLVSASFHTALSRSLTLYHSVHSVRLLFDQISFALCPALTYQKCFKREFCLNAHLSSLESTMTDHYEYRVGGFTFSYHSQMPKL